METRNVAGSSAPRSGAADIEPQRIMKPLLRLLAVVAMVGIPVLLYRMGKGLGVTALGTVVPWGLWVAFYIFFIGLSAGSFLLSTTVYVFRRERLAGVGRVSVGRRFEDQIVGKRLAGVGRLALVQALVCLAAGLAFISVDLGHWERFWHVLVYPQWRSVLPWEVYLYTAYAGILLLALYFIMRCDLSRWGSEAKGSAQGFYRLLSLGFRCPDDLEAKRACDVENLRRVRLISIIGIPIALAAATDMVFAVVKARPAWFSPGFALGSTVSALTSAAALLLFVRAMVVPAPEKDRALLQTLARLTGVLLVVNLFILAVELLTGFYGGVPDHLAVLRLTLFGPFWWVFWILQLAVGAALPLLLIYGRVERATPGRLGLAGLLVTIGLFGERLNDVIPAQAVPVFPGLDTAVSSGRLTALYVPNGVEWLSSWGIVALTALLTYFVMRRLPMVEHQSYPGEE